MPTFAYSGRTRGGETVTGERVADNADAAVAALRREQVLVTRIAATREKAGSRAEKGKLGKKVNPKNLAIFVRQFSVMMTPACRWSSAWKFWATRKRTRTSPRRFSPRARTSKAARRLPTP